MNKVRNIQTVVKNLLCTACGTCVHICPSKAIEMQETPGGLLFAQVNEDKCTQCGLCLEICPGDHLNAGVLTEQADPFKGQVLSAYCGRAADPDIFTHGQSGGVATALLCHLLENGDIDKALVTQMPEDGSLRPVCVLTDDKDQISKAQGSKYCPVPLNAYLPPANEYDYSKLAVVGLPCHFHGICNRVSQKKFKRPLLIGLICERIMSFAVIEYLIQKSRLPRSSVISMRYKDKSLGGWPGNISITSNTGQTAAVSSHHRMWCKGLFTPPCCYLCFDKMNVLSDIVLGDAWGVDENKEGSSVILARTARGHKIIEEARRAGIIQVDPIDPEAVFKGQHIETKRRDWTALTSTWQQMGNQPPEFNIQPQWYADIYDLDQKPHLKKINKAVKLFEVLSSKKMLKQTQQKYFLSRIKLKLLILLHMNNATSKNNEK